MTEKREQEKTKMDKKQKKKVQTVFEKVDPVSAFEKKRKIEKQVCPTSEHNLLNPRD